MKVLLQRHGIVIKSVAIHGDRASIGSSAESDVMIDDPYLAGHVADIVKEADGWHLVDSGTSLEGVTHNGTRVDDELVITGEPYSVGGFELVVQLEGDEAAAQERQIKKRTAERIVPGTVAGDAPVVLATIAESVEIPRTMMDTALPSNEIPKTMFEAPMPAAAPRQAPPPPRPAVQPQGPPVLIPPVSSRPVAAATSAPPNRKRILLLASAVGVVFILLVVVIIGGSGSKKPKPSAKVAKSETNTTAAPTTTAPVTPVVPSGTPTQHLASLNYDAALSSWEKELASPSASSATRNRYAELALEVGRIHAANGSPKAPAYFANVVKYGAPDSPAVAEAKRRLGQ